MGKLKSKHVLLCSEFTELGSHFVKILLEQDVKTITITNNNNLEEFGSIDVYKNSKIKHLKADVTKIEDMEGIYKQTIKANKKIDVIINSKEIKEGSLWENEITTHINSMICSTLLAMKHLGKMNSGKGGMVVNSLTAFSGDNSSKNTMYMGISSLIDDLDRSFGDPYYYHSTGVQVLTMCTNMEIGNSENEGLEGTTSSSSSSCCRWDARGSTLLKVIEERKSHVQMIGVDAAAEENKIEQFEIALEN